ncbi:MAG: hypothetical protein Q9187_007646, partial [Circinaria calcarea]
MGCPDEGRPLAVESLVDVEANSQQDIKNGRRAVGDSRGYYICCDFTRIVVQMLANKKKIVLKDGLFERDGRGIFGR